MSYPAWIGKRVRATRTETLTGTPERCADESHVGCAVIDGRHLVESGANPWTFERLPDEGTEYRPGDVILDGAGMTWRRYGDGDDAWWVRVDFGRSVDRTREFQLREPITLLVRDRSAITP